MPDQKRTKIVATLGPATSEREILKKMIQEGVDVFRVNFSAGRPIIVSPSGSPI